MENNLYTKEQIKDAIWQELKESGYTGDNNDRAYEVIGIVVAGIEKITPTKAQPGPRWVNVSKRLPENDMHMDYPREYCLMCKCDGSRGAVEYKQGSFSEIQDLWQNGPYDVIWWLDERSNANHSTPAGREEDAVAFAEELWDNHSVLIGEDIFTLEQYANREVMKKDNFMKAITAFKQQKEAK